MFRRALAILSMIVAPAAAQATEPGEVMLLGSYHLVSNNLNLITMPIEDVLTDRRQAEIGRMVDGLARWKPTRVAVEWPRSKQAALDRRYADYLAGRVALSADEHEQIGFRLARKLGLPKVDAIDWTGDFPGSHADYDYMGWAKRNGQGDRFARFVEEGQAEANQQAAAMRGQTVSQWYRDLNTPEQRLKMHRSYFTTASFGTDEANPGAAWVGGWYARNLRIFNNLREFATPGERVFVIYGAGHAHFLDSFVRESGGARLVDPRRYLPRR